MHEKETPVPPNVGSEIQSLVGMLNFISWGVFDKLSVFTI